MRRCTAIGLSPAIESAGDRRDPDDREIILQSSGEKTRSDGLFWGVVLGPDTPTDGMKVIAEMLVQQNVPGWHA